MQTDRRIKRGDVLFVIAIVGWLVAFTATRALSLAVIELYRATEVAPFTVRTWWQVLPWLVIVGLSVEYWLVLRRKNKMDTKHHVLYYVSLSMAFLFIVLSFRPLVVLLPIVRD